MKELYPVVLDLFNVMDPYEMNYLYSGDFSPELTNSILSFAEGSLDNMGESTRVRKKVYFIMVESLQNITRHQENTRAVQGAGYFIIQGLQNGYFITSCNQVAASSVNSLRGKLEMVNSLDAENLKNYSAEILQAGEISAKGGAGLGLIEMARKSGHKLKYHFEKIDPENSLFYFQIKVSPAGTELPVDADKNFTGARELHKVLERYGLNIIYKGNFSQENVKGILAMIEGSMSEKNRESSKRKMFNLIMELLQNIYKHGDAKNNDADNSRPGIFMIGTTPGKYVLVAGSLIENRKVESLRGKIDHVNQLAVADLEKFYAAKLMDEDLPGAKGAGLGLIDMRLKCGSPINYDFRAIDNRHSLLTLALSVPDK